MMEEFKVGSKIVPKSSFSVQNVYTVYAVGEPSQNGYPAWVKFGNGFGEIVNLEYMKLYFEPGYLRSKGSPRGDVKYFHAEPDNFKKNYDRVEVSVVEEDDE
jgi:hypothetical protein